MKRAIPHASIVSKVPGKRSAKDGKSRGQVTEAANPFVTFSQWSGEADEKAYAALSVAKRTLRRKY
jgi:hypothetical protein